MRQGIRSGSMSTGSNDATPLLSLGAHSSTNNTVVVAPPEPRKVTWARRLNPILGRRNVDDEDRVLFFGERQMDTAFYPSNKVNNRKYSVFTFFFLSLKQQFVRSWNDWNVFNVYYLFLSVSQFIPIFQVGFWFTYLMPLAFVVMLSMAKELFDDVKRFIQDRTINSARYKRLLFNGEEHEIESENITVGMLLKVEANQRIPADLVLLHTSEASGTCFIRTDQLDGETDWKLRLPASLVATYSESEIRRTELRVTAEKPSTQINSFVGSIAMTGADVKGLNVENMLWCGCTVTAGSVVGLVVYTGVDTRIAMNQQQPEPKSGLVDRELNWLSLLCFGLLLIMSLGLVLQQYVQYQFDVTAFCIYLLRFQILLSTIVPISMRVNIDVARFWYTFNIVRDKELTGIMVRNTNIPEELGRIRFLFSDKTGTLTRNKMEFRELHVAEDLCVEHDAREDFNQALDLYFTNEIAAAQSAASSSDAAASASAGGAPAKVARPKRVMGMGPKQAYPIGHAVLMLALCNNVTPDSNTEAPHSERTYQAASPDEVAMVEFAASIGVQLDKRSIEGSSKTRIGEVVLRVQYAGGMRLAYDVLKMFPFSSERKSMGIILREQFGAGRILFYMKGADSRMMGVLGVQSADEMEWLKDKCLQMASNGRRTLVFAYKELRPQDYAAFDRELDIALATSVRRDENVEAVMQKHEVGFRVGCATGVDDQLQENVIPTLERLRHSGIRIWMLTGDKVETAMCIAKSTKLFAPDCAVEQIVCSSEQETEDVLTRMHSEHQPVVGLGEPTDETIDFLGEQPGMTPMGLVIDGNTLRMVLDKERLRDIFVELATRMASVVVARCSPTQKAQVVKLVMEYSDRMSSAGQQGGGSDAPRSLPGKGGGVAGGGGGGCCSRCCSSRASTVVRTAAIGDGGNDVSMILSAHVGIGVEGKEGKQASLAADFSITRFCDVDRLLTWHGRNAYQSTCQLAQLVLHRGIIYAVVQAVFSMLFRGSTMTVFNSYMIMLYPTFLTMAPVFGIVLNEDSKETDIDNFPEKYKMLFKSRSLNTKSFLCWVWLSFLQGGVMMLVALESFGGEFFRIVSVAFTSLLATELLVVAACINYRILWQSRKQWKIGVFLLSIVFSVVFYFAMVFFLPGTIDKDYVVTAQFWETVGIVTASSVVPSFIIAVFGWWLTKRLSKPRGFRGILH